MAALLASKTTTTKELVSPFRQTKKIKHANWCRSGSSRRQELCFFWCVDCLLSKRWSSQKIFEIESPRLQPIKSSLEPNVFTTWHYEEFDSSLWPTPLMFTMSSGLPWTQQGKWTSTWLWSWVMSVQRCHWLPPGGLFIRPGQTVDLGKYLTWASQQKEVCFRSYKAVYKPRRCWFTLKPQL